MGLPCLLSSVVALTCCKLVSGVHRTIVAQLYRLCATLRFFHETYDQFSPLDVGGQPLHTALRVTLESSSDRWANFATATRHHYHAEYTDAIRLYKQAAERLDDGEAASQAMSPLRARLHSMRSHFLASSVPAGTRQQVQEDVRSLLRRLQDPAGLPTPPQQAQHHHLLAVPLALLPFLQGIPGMP
jgi:hypothetical protein